MPRLVFSFTFAASTGLLLTLVQSRGSDENPPAKEYSPHIEKASDEAVRALKGFRIPSGMKASLFAAEPLLANPIAFCFDEKGRCFVAETFRLHKGVTDNREH